MDLRRRVYANEANEDVAASLYNLGFLLAQLGDVGDLVRATEVHEECIKIYEQLGGARKSSK